MQSSMPLKPDPVPEQASRRLKRMSILKELKRGVFLENPTFRLLLGMCPTLAVTTLAINGIGMGLATAAVLIGSNVVIAALKNVIPSQVRIPCYIVIISTFVTIISMLM